MRDARGGFLAGFTISIVAVLAVAAVLFASADGTVAIARDATVQQRAEAVLGAAAVVRGALSESLLLAEAQEAGVAGASELSASLADGQAAAQGLAERWDSFVEVVSGAPPDVLATGQPLMDTSDRIIELLEEDRDGEARRLAETEFVSRYADFVTAVAAERDLREQRIAAARQDVGRVTTAARFLVAFLVPALAMLAFRALVRRRQHQAMLEQRLAEEQRLNQAKDQFIASVSHELRTPLTAVLGFSEVLREGQHGLASEERDELIDLIAGQAEESAHIIEDLLVAARADLGELTVQPESFDARALVDSILYGWDRRSGGRPQVEGTATAWADPMRTRQIVRNLLANAVRYGGSRLGVRLSQVDGRVALEVVDDGPGVSDDERQRIFEPYRRAHSRRGEPASVGLGLTVSRRLARLMGGDLVYRREGAESVFELTLPSAGRTVDPGLNGDQLSAPVIRELLNDGPEIIFQPIVELFPDQGLVRGWEALSRFPSRSAREWFTAASDVGLRLELELAAVERAVREFASSRAEGFLAVNLSDQTLRSERLTEALAGLEADRVVLELTEAEASKDYEAVHEAARSLRVAGYRIAIDDVGSGVLDLWQVLRLEPALIKLDPVLTGALNGRPAALVRGLSALAADIGAEVVAEGVEEEEQLIRLVELGVRLGQGYLLAAPGPLPVSVG